jgi:hypothetical protein
MARSRRGSFGLQPRVVPNVSAQIVALAREYVAKRDALIMDAWRNGGTFEGKKATDDMVLAYWKERESGLDPGDPEYESAKNNVMQLQYAIEQSKADVLHVQGKMSDTAYAQFFLKWAKKVPKNSEFYRTLQKDAAQLIESAKAKGRANAERAKTEAFNAFVNKTTSSEIAIGDAMTKALDDLSKRTGLSVTGNGDELLAMLTSDVKTNPDAYRALLDTIKKGDPGWDGQLTEGYFNQHIKSAVQGYSLIADRAQKGGFVSAYANATQGMSAMSAWGQNLRVWPVAETYTNSENAFLKVWNDPNASQMDKQNAASQFSAQLIEMSKTPGIDAGSKSMIEADAQRLMGQDAGDNPSFGTAMLGRQGVDPAMTMQLGAWQQTKMAMEANPAAWSYAPVDKNGQFDPTGRGALGMVPAGAVQPGAQAVMVPGADGKAVMAMVAPHTVYAIDPNNPSGSPKVAGYQLSYMVGGRSVQLWGYKDAAGASHWSLTSPLTAGATTQVDTKGDVFVTPPVTSATDPIERAKQIDAKLGTNLASQLQAQKDSGTPLDGVTVTQNNIDPKTGKNLGSTEVTYKNGAFTATEKQNTLDAKGKVIATQSTPINVAGADVASSAFSPSRMSAGDVPGTTFSSPLQASVQAAAYTQTQDQVSKFASDPAFQQAFLKQTMETYGISNPYDPRIASAWKNVTTASASADPEVTGRNPQYAANRADLKYPGEQMNKAAYSSNLTVNFGSAGELRLPGLPSYMKNMNVNLSPLGDAAKTVQGIMGNILPGLGMPSQTPVGSPAVTPAATPTPTPTAAAPAPSNLPTPTPAPTSIPGPSPSPTQDANQYRYPRGPR